MGKASVDWGSDVGVSVDVDVGAIELSSVGVGAGVTEREDVRGGMIAIGAIEIITHK